MWVVVYMRVLHVFVVCAVRGGVVDYVRGCVCCCCVMLCTVLCVLMCVLVVVCLVYGIVCVCVRVLCGCLFE